MTLLLLSNEYIYYVHRTYIIVSTEAEVRYLCLYTYFANHVPHCRCGRLCLIYWGIKNLDHLVTRNFNFFAVFYLLSESQQ
jgi:hypothetical protein